MTGVAPNKLVNVFVNGESESHANGSLEKFSLYKLNKLFNANQSHAFTYSLYGCISFRLHEFNFSSDQKLEAAKGVHSPNM